MAENVPNTRLGKLYDEHIKFIIAHDVDNLLAQYDDDCLLISTMTDDHSPLYVRGKVELEKFFRERIFALAELKSTIAMWAEDSDNVLMMVEAIEFKTTDGAEGKCRFYDNWVLTPEFKIKTHFAGVVQYPDGSIA